MTDEHVLQFQDSMNEHGIAQYKSFTTGRQTFVVEFERHQRMGSHDARGRIVVWEKPRGPDADPREDRWTDRVSKWGLYEDLEPVYRNLNDIEVMRDLIDEKNEQRDN